MIGLDFVTYFKAEKPNREGVVPQDMQIRYLVIYHIRLMIHYRIGRKLA